MPAKRESRNHAQSEGSKSQKLIVKFGQQGYLPNHILVGGCHRNTSGANFINYLVEMDDGQHAGRIQL